MPGNEDWIRVYSSSVLAEIAGANVFPLEISQIITQYSFNSIVRLRWHPAKWPWEHGRACVRPPAADVILELSDTLRKVEVAFRRIRSETQGVGVLGGPGWGRSTRMMLAFDAAEDAATSEVALTSFNLKRQLGEALHWMGVTWTQLASRNCVVHVKLMYTPRSKYTRTPAERQELRVWRERRQQML